MQRFFEEVIRRKVLPVAAAYAIAGWVLLQVGDVLIGLLELPGWIGKILVAAVILGLPVALILAWIYDWTPKGIVATGPAVKKHFEFGELGPIDVGQLDLGRPQLTPLIGRQSECALIAKRLDEAADGKGGIVLIGGEPGVGKTRLGEEVLELAMERQILPLIGHAYEETGTPFIISTEILEDIVRALPPDVLRDALGPTAPEISRLLPDLRRLLPDIPEPMEVPSEQQQRYLFNALLEFTERLGNAAPLVMLLDDLQWADESSMLLLEHFVPHLPRLPVLFVITYRDVAADMREPFKRALARLSRDESVTRISLRQLSRDDVAALLNHLGGDGAPDSVIDAIFEDTSGNVFFVKSVFQHLAEDGRLFDDDGGWRTDIDPEQLAVPESVRLVIEQRLGRLGEQTASVLATAAVIGLRFDLEVLEKVVGGDPDDVLQAIEHAETAGFVLATSGSRDNRYEFSHALVQHTLLDALSNPRRQRLHLQIAEAMAALFGDADRRVADIARHYDGAGSAADIFTVRHFLTLAGERALATSAADEAYDFFDRALALDANLDDNERADLLQARGRASWALRNWQAAAEDWLEALPALEARGKRDVVIKICWDVAYLYLWQNRTDDARAIAMRGLETAEQGTSTGRARLLTVLGNATNNSGDLERGDELLVEALAMAEELGDEALASEVLVRRAYGFHHSASTQKMLESAENALELARSSGHPWVLSSALGVTMLVLPNSGDFARALELAEEAEPLAAQEGDMPSIGILEVAHGYCAFGKGDLETARAHLEKSTAVFREAGIPWFTLMLCFEATCSMLEGDTSTARRKYEDAVSCKLTERWAGFDEAHLLWFSALEADERAPELLEQLEALLPRPGSLNGYGSWMVLMAWIEAAIMLGRREEAARLYPLTQQLIATGTVVTWPWLTERTAGIAAAAGSDWQAAERHFETALEQAETIPLRPEQAEVRRWYARALLERRGPGDRGRALQMLTEARALSESMKAHGQTRWIDAQLAAERDGP